MPFPHHFNSLLTFIGNKVTVPVINYTTNAFVLSGGPYPSCFHPTSHTKYPFWSCQVQS